MASAGSPANASDIPLTPVVRPLDTVEDDPVARHVAALIDGARPTVKAYPINLDALPRVTVQPELDDLSAARLDRSKLVEDPDLVIKPVGTYERQYMSSFSFREGADVTFGHLSARTPYGPGDGWTGNGFPSAVSMYVTCGANTPEVVPLHAHTLKLANGVAKYTMIEAVLDRKACKILTVRRASVEAKPLLPGGIAYGFRACVGSCAEDEELTVLYPRTTASSAGALGGGAVQKSGSFSAVAFPIQRGGGGAFMARIQRRDLQGWSTDAAAAASAPEWLKKLAPNDWNRATAMFLTSLDLGVEVSQATADEAPIAIAYTDLDPAELAAVSAPKPVVTAPAPTIPMSQTGLIDPFLDRR